jgi:hypothetical protein
LTEKDPPQPGFWRKKNVVPALCLFLPRLNLGNEGVSGLHSPPEAYDNRSLCERPQSFANAESRKTEFSAVADLRHTVKDGDYE